MHLKKSNYILSILPSFLCALLVGGIFFLSLSRKPILIAPPIRSITKHSPQDTEKSTPNLAEGKGNMTLHRSRDRCQNFVTLKEVGRLGNLIVQYSTLWAVRKASGIKVLISDIMKSKLTPLFPNLSIKSFKEEGCPNNSKNIVKMSQASMDQLPYLKVMTFDYFKAKAIIVPPFYVRPELFGLLRPQVSQEFRFHPHISTRAHATLNEIRAQFLAQRPNVSQVIFSSVHARRTDYNNYVVKRLRGLRMTQHYFLRAMNIFRKKFGPSLVFVAVSDDVPWIKTHFAHLSDVFFSSDFDRGDIDPVIFDFSIMANCNHSIYSYGTFGFSSAFLAGGHVIAAKTYNYSRFAGKYMETRFATNWTLVRDPSYR